MKRGSQPNMGALYEFYICSLISQGVLESLRSVRQCANTPRTEKKASRHQQEVCVYKQIQESQIKQNVSSIIK